MPVVVLKAYFCEKVDGEHTVRFLVGTLEEHELFEKQIFDDSDVVIALSQYICCVDVDDVLFPPRPLKGEKELKKRVESGIGK